MIRELLLQLGSEEPPADIPSAIIETVGKAFGAIIELGDSLGRILWLVLVMVGVPLPPLVVRIMIFALTGVMAWSVMARMTSWVWKIAIIGMIGVLLLGNMGGLLGLAEEWIAPAFGGE